MAANYWTQIWLCYGISFSLKCLYFQFWPQEQLASALQDQRLVPFLARSLSSESRDSVQKSLRILSEAVSLPDFQAIWWAYNKYEIFFLLKRWCICYLPHFNVALGVISCALSLRGHENQLCSLNNHLPRGKKLKLSVSSLRSKILASRELRFLELCSWIRTQTLPLPVLWRESQKLCFVDDESNYRDTNFWTNDKPAFEATLLLCIVVSNAIKTVSGPRWLVEGCMKHELKC